jgi:hypothetical protein
MTFWKYNQFSTLIQSHPIEFLGWNDVETTLIQPGFAQWVGIDGGSSDMIWSKKDVVS